MKKGLLRECWALMRPYWTSEERWQARGLLAVIVGLSLGQVYLSVLFNEWNNDFYNSLQAMDKHACYAALIYFCWLAFFFIIIAVYRVYLNQMLRIKWRRWMTRYYLSEWLDHQHYYRMQLLGAKSDNPDQRIAEDIEQFIHMTLELSLGLLSSVVTLFSFLAILWTLSGPANFILYGIAIHIPGYMVWAALLYAIIGTWLTFKIGRPLVALNFNQQRFEADFRFSLVRLRENTESIAFYCGEEPERVNFITRFTTVVDNFWQIMKRQKRLNWFTSFYGQIAIIFPFVVALPRYFAKEIQLGGLMQTASAFGQVQGALSYIIDAYSNSWPNPNIPTWQAVIGRLSGFNQSMAQAEAMREPAGFARRVTAENSIVARGLSLKLPDGSPLLDNISLTVRPGDSLLIAGPSGVGKSTLLRALAGLWPFAEGELMLPEPSRLLFVPQKPYLPLGTLRQALCYPRAALAADAEIQPILALCGLVHLKDRLDGDDSWSQILSLGEQQRVAFARILLTRPDFALLDEATSALDEAAEAQLYALIRDKLPQLAIVSVGHRSTLQAWHAQVMALGNAAA